MVNHQKAASVESENFWRKAFQEFSNHSLDGLMIVNPAGKILHVNESYCSLSGYTQEELLKLYVRDIEGRLNQTQILKHTEMVAATGRTRFESAHRKKDGSSVEVEVTMSLIEIEQNQYFVVITRDLTEFKEVLSSINAGDAIKELSIKATTRKEYFDSVVKMIRNWSDCKHVGLRLLDSTGNVPYESYVGYSTDFWKLENWISLDDHCICTRVINKQLTDSESPYTTPQGSFYCNDFIQFASNSPSCGKTQYRGTCAKCGYKSIAVIPIRYYKDILGTIQISDERPDKVPFKLVKFMEKVAGFIGEAVYRFKTEEELRHNFDTLRISDSLARLSLEGASLTQIMESTLENVCSISWIPFKSWGCIFLVDKESKELVLKAQKGIREANKHLCERVPIGTCCCGRVAQTKKILFASSSDNTHDIKYDGMAPHSHYCVPIVFSGETLGVINLYLNEGYKKQRRDEMFLQRIADKLAQIIVRRRVQKDLEYSEKHLSLIHNSVTDLIYLLKIEPNHVYTYITVNRSYLEKMGLKEEDVIGKSVEEVLPRSALPFVLSKYREAIDHLVPQEFQISMDLPKGQIVLDTMLTPILNDNGQCTHILGASHDITDRKKAETALQESQERYRSLVKQSSDGVYIFDPVTKKIQEVNDQLLYMLGYNESEITNLSAYKIAAMECEDFDAQIEQALIEGMFNTGACKYVKKDGSLLDVEVTISQINYRHSTIMMANVRDITERKNSERKLKQSFKYLRNTLRETVNALTIIAEKRDPYTVGHQHRVSQLAVAIAREMGFSEDMIEGIRVSGLLHDIGKVGVPIEILTKPGRLGNLEMSIIKNHPQVGFEIIQKIPFECPVAQTVLQHQERYDGSGYPLGIAGENILLEARIMSVADVVEAMASHRPYRPSLGIDIALDEIRRNRGVYYDPMVVDACLNLFEKGFTWE